MVPIVSDTAGSSNGSSRIQQLTLHAAGQTDCGISEIPVREIHRLLRQICASSEMHV